MKDIVFQLLLILAIAEKQIVCQFYVDIDDSGRAPSVGTRQQIMIISHFTIRP